MSDQASEWSELSRWQMGLLSPDDWTARWISLPPARPQTDQNPPAYLRQVYSLDKPIARADSVCATARGIYALHINGRAGWRRALCAGLDRLCPAHPVPNCMMSQHLLAARRQCRRCNLWPTAGTAGYIGFDGISATTTASVRSFWPRLKWNMKTAAGSLWEQQATGAARLAQFSRPIC